MLKWHKHRWTDWSDPVTISGTYGVEQTTRCVVCKMVRSRRVR